MRFELTTATLEGWSSTIELCPPEISKWAGVVSNHRRPEPMDLQSIPFNHSGTYPYPGADGGTQTPDHSITSRTLYQLSYIGKIYEKSLSNIIKVINESQKKYHQLFLETLSTIPYFLASSADIKKS